jgi:DtxR family Mn-dependent transcriptional regulator
MHQHQDEILEAIWNAEEDGDTSVAAVKTLCPEPISEADLSLLQREGMIERQGETLHFTERGRRAGRDLIRRHRLAATLLYTVLDLDRERREEVACEVEHTLVAELADGICTMLGHPREGPDGKPIPPGDCCEGEKKTVGRLVVPLTEIPPGGRARVLFIKAGHNDRLRRLTSFGLTPGVEVTVHQKKPAYYISFGGTELALESRVAAHIHVSPLEERTQPARAPKRRRRRGRRKP